MLLSTSDIIYTISGTLTPQFGPDDLGLAGRTLTVVQRIDSDAQPHTVFHNPGDFTARWSSIDSWTFSGSGTAGGTHLGKRLFDLQINIDGSTEDVLKPGRLELGGREFILSVVIHPINTGFGPNPTDWVLPIFSNSSLSGLTPYNLSGGDDLRYGFTSVSVTTTFDDNPPGQPSINFPAGPLTFDEDVSAPFAGVSVTDPDSTTLDVTLNSANGTFTVAATAGVVIAGNGSNSVLLEGSQAAPQFGPKHSELPEPP